MSIASFATIIENKERQISRRKDRCHCQCHCHCHCHCNYDVRPPLKMNKDKLMIVNMSLCTTQLRLGATRCDYVRLLATPNGRFTNVTLTIIIVVINLYSVRRVSKVASSNKVIKHAANLLC